jgi:hypothetical protein
MKIMAKNNMPNKNDFNRKELFYFEWIDILDSPLEWHTVKEIKEYYDKEKSICSQVGWVVDETPQYLIVTSQWMFINKKINMGSSSKIPKGCIVKKQLLNGFRVDNGNLAKVKE